MANPNFILNEFKKIYPELSLVKIKYFSHDNFIGCCETTKYGDFTYEGKFRYQLIIPKIIKLKTQDEAIIFTLLHEIAHAITPYYERKIKNEWIRLDHSDKFYKNFHKIMLDAYEMKIVDKQFTLKKI